MLDIEKVTMTVSQCCNEGKGSRNYPQLMKIWPPCRCGRENNIVHTIVPWLCLSLLYRCTWCTDFTQKETTWQMSLPNKTPYSKISCWQGSLCFMLLSLPWLHLQNSKELLPWNKGLSANYNETKVDYNLATSLEIEDITCQRGDMRSLVKYFFSTWEEKFRISKRPCYVLFLI